MGVIEATEGINATKMARELGITKGAISQTLARLEKKGILYKTRDHRNKNELTAHFTKLGKDVLKNHHVSRLSLQKEYEQYLTTLTNKEKKVVSQFLSNIEGFVDRLG
jgi:DNA-binding MarR family transcriptional regulator